MHRILILRSGPRDRVSKDAQAIFKPIRHFQMHSQSLWPRS